MHASNLSINYFDVSELHALLSFRLDKPSAVSILYHTLWSTDAVINGGSNH